MGRRTKSGEGNNYNNEDLIFCSFCGRLRQEVNKLIEGPDGILICDELEASLHESVIFQIVQLFQHYQKDKFAQLIFSTHDTSLLDKDLFRRDQVWFTQLNKERATDLYSLVEIKNVRKSENLEKGYVSGKYGAIPMLNKKFFYELEENILG